METRWLIIDPPPCEDAITLSGAGFIDQASNINGDYCPNGDVNGRPSWSRVGGDPLSTSDSISWTGSEWEVRRGGTQVYTNPDGDIRPMNGSWVPAFAPPDEPPVWSRLGDRIIMQVHPINGSDTAYSDDRSLESGQIFYRRKLSSPLTFGSHTYKNEYLYFYNAFRGRGGSSIGRCGTIYLRQDMLCADRWQTIWEGRLSPSNGHFSRKKCLFTVKPDPDDKYGCIMDRFSTKYNVLDLQTETLDVPIMATLDIQISTFDLTGSNDYELAASVVDEFGCTIYVNWQEIVHMPCSGGSPVAPGGPGWTLQNNYCASNGYAIYSRAPSIPWTFGDPAPGTWGIMVDEGGGFIHGEQPIPPDDSCDWIFGRNGSGYSVGCYVGDPGTTAYQMNRPWYICQPIYSIQAATTTLERARDFAEALSAMYAPCGGIVVSDFLEINPVGDAPGYVAGENYVTGDTNKVSSLKLVQMSDAVSQTSNPATLGETTLKDLLGMLQSMRLYWDIDSDGNLRIEHWKYWQAQQGIDVRNFDNTERDEFDGLGEKPPRAEECFWGLSIGADFLGKRIIYYPPCASEEEESVKKFDFKDFFTDLPAIITNTTNFNNFPKQGFLLISCDAGTSDVSTENGEITGLSAANMHLSWANLHANYWTWDRLLPDGNMNGNDVTFDGFVPNVKQDEFGLDICCDYPAFNPRNAVTCALSVSLGSATQVKRATFRPKDGQMRLTLLHSFD